MTRTKVIIALGIAAGLGACASAPSNPPAWYTQRESTIEQGYPSLRSVPRTNIADTDETHWAAVEADMLAAGAELRNNPRAQPAPATDDANAFIDDARQALEETRQSHQ